MSGTIASKAGAKKAWPAPYTATSATMCQTSSIPVSESIAMAPTASPRTTSAASITRLRSTRSLTTPPTSRKTMVGTVIAIPTIARAAGAFERA